MLDEDKDHIEQLKSTLYSRTAPDIRTRRKLRFSDHESEIQKEWGDSLDEPVPTILNKNYEDHSMSFFTKLLIGSIIFCVLAIGVGSYLFFNGSNLISGNNIDITIDGPVSIPGGEPVSFDVTVVNKNNVDLQVVDMAVDFPTGSADPANPSKELKEYRQLIGNIATGATAHETIQALLFGEENLQKEISVTLTYSIKGSTSVFTKTKTYAVILNSSPINMTVNTFKEITTGQVFDMKVDIKSNSQQILHSLALQATYPFGYTFVSSDLKPLSDNASWIIGDLPPGAERIITIHGMLKGEDGDTRSFHFIIGAQNSTTGNGVQGSTGIASIGTEYTTVQQDISIQKPFLSLKLAVDDDSTTADVNSRFGVTHTIKVNYFNNLTVPISNVQLSVHLSGSAYDRGSVQAEQGYFQSATDDITWNQQTTPALSSVAAGDSGQVEFIISAKDMSTSGRGVVDPVVTITANASGDRAQESQVPETLKVITSRSIKVSSAISLSGRVLRTVGPFTNTGPIPPQVDKPTTYTIVWTANNTTNPVNNTEVTASLPAYVKWLGIFNPSNEDVSYDVNTGVVTWNVGNLAAYANSASQRREIYFQVSIQPSLTQVTQAPILVNQASMTATDAYTGIPLSASQNNLTTRFSTDPTYQESSGVVVK